MSNLFELPGDAVHILKITFDKPQNIICYLLRKTIKGNIH